MPSPIIKGMVGLDGTCSLSLSKTILVSIVSVFFKYTTKFPTKIFYSLPTWRVWRVMYIRQVNRIFFSSTGENKDQVMVGIYLTDPSGYTIEIMIIRHIAYPR